MLYWNNMFFLKIFNFEVGYKLFVDKGMWEIKYKIY